MNPKLKKTCGFTLIEVLIAVLILSIGLLSLALTQVNSMRSTHSSHLRTQATFLADDILDSIRANRVKAEDGDYDIAIGVPASGTGTMALDDLNTWKGNLAGMLPAGDGAIARDVATGEVTVTVQWRDRDDATTDPPTQFLLSTIP
jgi:type IV pilus assembly protein PilV